MSFHSLTAGAERALENARRLAEIESADSSVACNHLFWALALEENRANEILVNAKLTVAVLENHFPLKKFNVADADSVFDAVESFDNAAPNWDVAILSVVAAASDFARRIGAERTTEVGTEHLLAGIIETDEMIAGFLSENGITIDHLFETTRSITRVTEEPLDVELQLRPVDQTDGEKTDLHRILDAAANRAREGLRVVEDYIRFVKNDSWLSKELKTLRHQLNEAISDSISTRDLVASRNTTGDVGTNISTASERDRSRPVDVLFANCKRSEEALRTLEEFGKLVSSLFAQKVEQIRYRFYTIEKIILQLVTMRESLTNASLYLLVTSELCEHGFGPAVRESIAGGVDIIQLREKNLPDRRIVEMGQAIRKWTHEGPALFIMNDRPDLAVLADADGVHLGHDDLSVYDARRIVGPDRIVGISTHSIEQARQAEKEGADYIGVGPVFSSTTKSFQDDQLVGLDLVRQVAEEISIPWFPIGGISLENLGQVIDAGATRVAVSSAICSQRNHTEVAQNFVNIIRK